MAFQLGDDRLTTNQFYQLASVGQPQVDVTDEAVDRVKQYRSLVEKAASSGETYYGINTGFGFLSNVCIESDKLSELQENILRSHSCAVGDPVSKEISRGLLLLRAHSFLMGHSGISWDTIEAILAFLGHDVLPYVPEKGSVGACGDLAPLAHVALGLMGEGKLWCDGEAVEAGVAFEKYGLKPIKPGPKEGLSLINGTHFMTTIAAFAVEEARLLAATADIATAMSLDASRGTIEAFDPRIHAVRGHLGQREVAENLTKMFSEPDEIMHSHKDCGRVQDPYSFRCTPQVHGASLDALRYVSRVIDGELNSITDNPLVFDNGDVVSGGNFHGQPVAMAMDFLGIAMAELGSISEQRLMKLTNPEMSGLPAFIVKDGGLNSGYMIPHVVAASLVSENKIYAHPAVVDSIPTSADKEDHVSMGPIAARKARMINRNVASILAIELLGACQGLDLLSPLKPNACLQGVFDGVRELSPFMAKDRALHEDIAKVADWILAGGAVKAAAGRAPSKGANFAG